MGEMTIIKYQKKYRQLHTSMYETNRGLYDKILLLVRADELRNRCAYMTRANKPMSSGTKVTFAPVETPEQYDEEVKKIVEEGKRIGIIQGLKIEPCEMNTHHCRMILEKLADYEEAEEQGLLVRLPCPIGTTVWDICGMNIRENVLSGIECGKDGKQFLWANNDEFLGELNDLVFLTREEAEKKLEEMKNND